MHVYIFINNNYEKLGHKFERQQGRVYGGMEGRKGGGNQIITTKVNNY